MNKKGILLSFSVFLLSLLILAPPLLASVPEFNIASKPDKEYVPGGWEILITDPGNSLVTSDPKNMCYNGSHESRVSRDMPLMEPDPIEFCSPQPILRRFNETEFCAYEPVDFFDFDLLEAEPAHSITATLDLSGYRLNPLAVRAVERSIKVFSESLKKSFSIYLSRSGKYLRMMKNILKEEGIPEDLAYLPLVESGFNIRAYSRMRAAGPWQFIAGTAKRYGLKVNWWVDERRDPVKSTRAAARYLRDLNEIFGSWSLALAAYNAGEGKVRRALRKTRHQDIWGLLKTRHLRLETRNYVPKFVAARIIATNPEEFGFTDIRYEEEFVFDEITLKDPLTIDIIAKCAETSTMVIKDLNPELRRWSTPPYAKGYTVRIPKGSGKKFFDNLAKIPREKRFGLRTYKVKRGDTVSGISKKTGVPVRAIIAYNKLSRRALIRPGQRLMLPVPANYQSYPLPENLPLVTLPGGVKAREYRVRRGDTLSGIAKKAGVSIGRIVRLNKLKSRSFIKTGQRLYLPDVREN